MKVLFNDLDEFLQELAADAAQDSIETVRVTTLLRPAPQLPGTLWSLTVVAGYVNAAGQLVEYREYVGDKSAHDDDDRRQRLKRACDSTRGRIIEACAQWALTVRDGRFVPPAEQ